MFTLFRRPSPVSTAAAAAAERAKARQAAALPETPTDWAAVRRPDRPQDQVLSPSSIDWLKELPADLRPDRLAGRFPRIVNRLSLCWSDRSLVSKVFESLLEDKRGGRRGFPPEILGELRSLREFALFGRKPKATKPATSAFPPGVTVRTWQREPVDGAPHGFMPSVPADAWNTGWGANDMR
jgi:hypothetical protein